jgi:hypothetical protein
MPTWLLLAADSFVLQRLPDVLGHLAFGEEGVVLSR